MRRFPVPSPRITSYNVCYTKLLRIAHDFNNILTPIIGYAELSLDSIPDQSPVRGYLREVLNAAMRAKELVQQILAFSRQSDQELKPIKVQP